MIKPSIGRIVWFNAGTEQMHAAQIAFVYSDSCVNLAVVDERGQSYSRTSVTLNQEAGEVSCAVGECQWMPYQKQVAAS